jgi:hypothetical protein
VKVATASNPTLIYAITQTAVDMGIPTSDTPLQITATSHTADNHSIEYMCTILDKIAYHIDHRFDVFKDAMPRFS